MPSISMLLREWAMQSIELGTRPSWAGERSVVRTRHQSGLSWGLSTSSTVWPLRTVNSDPLLAMKSWMTTVNSEPLDNCGGRHKSHIKNSKISVIKIIKTTQKSKVRTNVPTGNVALPMSSKGEPLTPNLYMPCFYVYTSLLSKTSHGMMVWVKKQNKAKQKKPFQQCFILQSGRQSAE